VVKATKRACIRVYQRTPGERARARQQPKPPPIPTGMEPLFEMETHP